MKALISALSLAFFAFSALAAPEPSPESAPAATTEKRDFDFNFGLDFWFNTPAAGALPKLKLPYGTWQASSYDSANDIYLFKNVRYAAPPVGNLRWAPPANPVLNTTLQDGSYGNICTQGSPPGLPFIYVPGIAIRLPFLSLPVTVYTHGGAFLFGSKAEGVGTGPIIAAGNLMIFVSMNYRLGSMGFLAGTTMEQQALPNAGFYDQRKAYEWVQSYINFVGGDKNRVTAWGESAGAGSILHHITAFGGTRDPLFHKVVLLSVASEVLVDRRGQVDDFYKKFASLAGCAGQPISCLRSVSFATLKAANQALILDVPPGGFKPGPAADGAWVRQMPALELASGNYFHGLDSVIVSHTANEGFVFVDGEIQSDAAFANLTNFIIPPYAPTVRAAVAAYYPTPGTAGQPYTDNNGRTIRYLDDTNFLCNYRYLNTAFQGRTWSMQYSIPPAFHSDDLAAMFYPGTGASSATLDGIYKDYQSYMVSLSAIGNPNIFRRLFATPPTINWPLTSGAGSEQLGNVLSVDPTGFSLINDVESLKSRCDFFLNVQAAITLAGGYVPPGGSVANNLGVTNASPSGNYTTPH